MCDVSGLEAAKLFERVSEGETFAVIGLTEGGAGGKKKGACARGALRVAPRHSCTPAWS